MYCRPYQLCPLYAHTPHLALFEFCSRLPFAHVGERISSSVVCIFIFPVKRSLAKRTTTVWCISARLVHTPCFYKQYHTSKLIGGGEARALLQAQQPATSWYLPRCRPRSKEKTILKEGGVFLFKRLDSVVVIISNSSPTFLLGSLSARVLPCLSLLSMSKTRNTHRARSIFCIPDYIAAKPRPAPPSLSPFPSIQQYCCNLHSKRSQLGERKRYI